MPVYKPTPRPELLGIKDVGGAGIAFEQILVPQHLPHVFTFAERGPETAFVSTNAVASTLFGSKTFDVRGLFTTHQTPYIRLFQERANTVLLHRLKPDNAKTAMLRISAEVIPAEIPLYERNGDGTYAVDGDGNLIQETNASNPVFVIGHRVILHAGLTGYTGAALNFAGANTVPNHRAGTVEVGGTKLSTLVDGSNNPVRSTLYPLFDLEVSSFGKYGDRIGVIFDAPNSLSIEGADTGLMALVKSFIYKLSLVERPENDITPIITDTLFSEKAIDISFKEETFNPNFDDQPLTIKDALLLNYQSTADETVTPIYAPFGRIHVYRQRFDELLKTLCEGGIVVNASETTIGEDQYDADANRDQTNTAFLNTPENYDLLNFLTGVDQYGRPYYTFDVSNSVLFGGVAFGKSNVIYASGGDDGLVIKPTTGRPDVSANALMFDKLVASQLNNYGSFIRFTDLLKYPTSCIYDSGFSIKTKEAMVKVIERRKDMYIVLATHRFGEYLNPNTPVDNQWSLADGQQTETEENAMASVLMSRLKLAPESEAYGTRVCRAIIFKQSGKIIGSKYPYFTPLSYHLADASSYYMGVSDGVWRRDGRSAPDDYPRNVITTLNHINNTSQSLESYHRDWANGLCYAINHDTGRQFIPALQTVYFDDTSTLNSFITIAGAVELEKVCVRSWRELVGGSRLTPAQFIQASNDSIAALVQDRFDNRFTIVPNTRFTAGDEIRGYSWVCDVGIYNDVMKLVGQYTIVSDRLQNLGS